MERKVFMLCQSIHVNASPKHQQISLIIMPRQPHLLETMVPKGVLPQHCLLFCIFGCRCSADVSWHFTALSSYAPIKMSLPRKIHRWQLKGDIIYNVTGNISSCSFIFCIWSWLKHICRDLRYWHHLQKTLNQCLTRNSHVPSCAVNCALWHTSRNLTNQKTLEFAYFHEESVPVVVFWSNHRLLDSCLMF